MRDDLSSLGVILEVADRGSFTAAAAELRVTPSAVSQAVDAVERRLGVRLFQRTTRSMSLTEAGAQLVAELRPALERIGGALAAAEAARGRPTGTLRLTIPRLAFTTILEPILADFMDAHPEVRLDLALDDGFVDLVERGYDAGIRLGEMLEKDMVAVPLTGEIRSVVVGAPRYFERRGRPKRPADLHAHDCINYRRISSREIYRWEFEVDGRDVAIAVDGRLITNDADVMLRAAIDGVGLAYLVEPAAVAPLADGRLTRVLARYCPRYPGLHLYYPSRQVPPKLRALVDFVRRRR